MKNFYTVALSLIFFLGKGQAAMPDPRIGQLMAQVNEMNAEIKNLNTNGTNKLQTIEGQLVNNFQKINENTKRIDKNIELIKESLINEKFGVVGILNEIKKSLNEIKESNKQEKESEKAPDFLIQDVISLHNEYVAKIEEIKNITDKLKEGKSQNDPICINLKNEIDLVKAYKDESEPEKFWDIIKKQISELDYGNKILGSTSKPIFSILMVSNLHQILLRRLNAMNYETIISKISNYIR